MTPASDAPTNLTHGIAVLDDVRLHYVTGGIGPTVVLLHGWAETWYGWRHVLPALARQYTVIAPDLRGLGDSSKPATGYDTRTVASDIYGLVRQLGHESIRLVGHDWGGPVAYAYAAAHPATVSHLAILDVAVPGFGLEERPTLGPKGGAWQLAFHALRDLPEMLVAGRERAYLSWCYKSVAYLPGAITEEDIDEYARCYAAPGGMRAGFEYFRAIFEDADQNRTSAATKLPMPVLALGAERGWGLGTRDSMQALASNVRGGVVERCGHWIPEERPDFLVEQLVALFAEDSVASLNHR